MSATARPLVMLDDPNATLGKDGTRETMSITVGAGKVRGDLEIDKVCLGPDHICAPRQSFVEVTEMSDEPFNLFPYDGVMGLGMPGISVDKSFNFMGNLADENVLRRNRFGVWTAAEGDGEDSELTFGAFDQDRVASKIVWLPVSDLTTGMWQAKMKDVVVGGVPLGVCGEGGCQVAFDTGTGIIAGPSSMMAAALGKLAVNQDCSNYDSLPTLGFSFDNFVLSISAADYVKRDGLTCYHQLLGVDTPPPRGPILYLGDPFLRRYYAIFDRDSLRVGLAFSRHKPGAQGGISTENAAAKLMKEVAYQAD